MKLYQVDAFTSQAFKGNPAGVCLLEKETTYELMQNIAAEMNLSETAFLLRTGTNSFQLRWFTPAAEVDLCGHATLASSLLPPEAAKALDISPLAVFGDKERFLIEISGLEELTAMKPNFNTLKEYPYLFMVTAHSDNQDYDFYSRFFAPSSGIDEDPVTGSAHSSLAPYWSKKLNGKTALIGYQASERSGVVECDIINNERLLIKGEVVIIFETELQV